MVLAPARPGNSVEIRGRSLDFSRWAMRRSNRRWGLSTRLFATDPWPVIRRAILDSKIPRASKDAAVAFLGQAKAYFRGAADAALAEAKPVLLYYCFLNLAKAFVLTRGNPSVAGTTTHGLSEKLHPNGAELVDAYLVAYQATATTNNVFDLFWRALNGSGLANANVNFDMLTLLPQVVPGHRLWAAGADEDERFLEMEEVQLLEDAHSVWPQLRLVAGDLTRFGIAARDVLRYSGLGSSWRQVQGPAAMVCFEPTAPTPFTSRAADKVMEAISTIAPHLWTTVRSDKPYRTYYLYMCPAAQVGSRMPQLCSIYAIAYYLGSITRYRPHHFTSIIDGPHGPFVEAFLNDQPTQFLYLLASEIAEREVTRAALA